jgi:shikimate kinase
MSVILLTGPKHSGKTTAARAFAALTGAEALDLDDLVTERSGKTPRELYKAGPEVFRRAEADALRDLAARERERPLVVAAGGGLSDNAEAMQLLRERRFFIVYLDVPAATAWLRILREAEAPGGELPPFLRTSDPEETHRTLHERRAAAYRAMADLVLECGKKTPDEIAKEIAGKTTKYYQKKRQ